MRARALLATLAFLIGAAQGAAAHEHMVIGSTVPGGGTLTLVYDFARPTVVAAPDFTSIDPSFAPQLVADPMVPIHPLVDGTTVRMEIVALDDGTSASIGNTTLHRPGDRKKIGDAPILHTHVTWGLAVPAGVVGTWHLSFRIVATNGYLDSPVYTIPITNLPVATTTTADTTSTTTTTTTSSTTTTTPPDTQLCYAATLAKGQPVPPAIPHTLADALTVRSAVADRVQGLCNPAALGGDAPPAHPAVGLEIVRSAAVRGTPAPVGSTHVVSDRFGTRAVTLAKPGRVLVPGGMADAPGPAPVPSDADATAAGGVDHRQCWEASTPRGTPPPPPVSGVAVADRFGSLVLDVVRLRWVCLPADVDDADPAARTSTSSLACYQVKVAKGSPRFVKRTDARGSLLLGAHLLDAKGVAFLCVRACLDAAGGCTIP